MAAEAVFPASGPRAEGETGFWHGKGQPVPRAELNLCWGGGRGAGRGCRAGEGGQRVPGGGHGAGGTPGDGSWGFPPHFLPSFFPIDASDGHQQTQGCSSASTVPPLSTGGIGGGCRGAERLWLRLEATRFLSR